ncbi:MAG: tetratricopeptide repeat protein [Elusimicrobiales bacterium]|nr:tetratricopeptide repeat protein [Elusimicrobiales bacterium]
MRRTIGVFLVLAFVAACSGSKRSDSSVVELDNPRWDSSNGTPPAFALPGVPLKSETEAAAPAAPAAEAPEAPAPPPSPAEPAAAAAAPDAAGKEFDFHYNAARKYAAAKRYRSAAAEYGAALGFLPQGDARAVQLLERQGAMLLKAGNEPKAQEQFQAAIARAGELGVSGKDLANAQLGLGYCLEKAGKVPDAIASYEKALELSNSKLIKARIAKTISDLKKAP